MQFTLTGPIMPAVRMTHRGKFVNERAQKYLANKEALAWQFKQQCQEMLPDKTPLMMVAVIEAPKFRKMDIDNQTKAILDSAQGIVFSNDCWIDSISVQRKQAKEHKATVWIDVIND